jgi:hypothetical protein
MIANQSVLRFSGVTWRTARRAARNHDASGSGSRRSSHQGDGIMIVDRAVHFVIGYIVAFGGVILLLPMIANAIGMG